MLIQHRKLLVLACGRSGTLYTSRVFRKAGFDLQHEATGAYGSCSMYFAAKSLDTTCVNAGQKIQIHGGERREDYEFEHIWHQVREPLKTIDSLVGCFTQKVRQWTHDGLGVVLPGNAGSRVCTLDDRLHWAMNYWLTGNAMCAAQASFTYRLEALPWDYMLRRLGEPLQPLPIVPSTTNRALRFAFRTAAQSAVIRDRMHSLTWNCLDVVDSELTKQIQVAAAGYGYKIK